MPSHILPDGSVPVLLSAHSAELLRGEAESIANYLRAQPDTSPTDVASTLFRTRTARKHRALIMATDTATLRSSLESIAANTPDDAVVAGERPAGTRRTAFVFPGQGSQRFGMGQLFYESSAPYRDVVDASEKLLVEEFDISVRSFLLGEGNDDSVRIVQPALASHMIGIARMWNAVGVCPDATVGHSQGEIAAAYISGAITWQDALRTAAIRSELVAEFPATDYSMGFLGIRRDAAEALMARRTGWTELTVINSPHAVCVAGDRTTVKDIVEHVSGSGSFAKEIGVSYPAHTSAIGQVRERLQARLRDACSSALFSEPDAPCFSSAVGGERITSDFDQSEYWYLNLRNVVRFDLAAKAMADSGIDTFVEMSDHPALQLAIEDTLGSSDNRLVVGTSRRTATTLTEFARAVATVAVHDEQFRWDALRDPSDTEVRLPLPDFPNSRMNQKRYWADRAVTPAPVPAEVACPERLVETWEQLGRRRLTRPQRISIIDHTGRCSELAAEMVAQAGRHGATAVLADGGADASDVDVVVALLPASEDMNAREATEALGLLLERHAEWLRPAGAPNFWVVTVGGEAVSDGDVPHLLHSAVGIAARSLGSEHVGTTFRHLDIDDAPVTPKRAAAVITALHTAGEAELALREGKLYAQRLVDEPADTDFGDLAEVMIVGGTGSVGRAVAERLVREGAGRITLVNRTGGSSEIPNVTVEACDVTDPDAVNAFAAARAGRPITLVVHAAVDYVHATAGDVDRDAVARASAAKLVGIETVTSRLELAPDCRVLLCSSVSATFGGPGLAVYASTNRMLDAVAHRMRSRGLNAVSVQWGVWADETRTDEAYHSLIARSADAGILSMAAESALTAGFTAGRRNCLVVSAEWSTIESVCGILGLRSLLPRKSESTESASAIDTVGHAAPVESSIPNSAATSRDLRSLLGRIMGFADDDHLDTGKALVALGMDSIQALDFHKSVKKSLDLEIPVAALLAGASFDDVTSLVTT
ncbi:acyltransferase domain-containing protein [Rhodococcoides kyotonense]|uniref:Mycobactin polyketide synthetase MbtD n=1 Tax=Rhodococcoides kyotonense TaxID=398843 RepID=A0A239N456_9NOCA|nr:acyltransferase domain-containing protein [Rhodococcus kyotonensis]SNT49224.1 mycobactin polyketide synthetase MbtD [Rhodococcus kyotonensis]